MNARAIPRLSVTARLLLILAAVALGIAMVFVFAIQGLKRTDTALNRLANVELEQLLTTSRLMQQSEMVANYARLVGHSGSGSDSERRLAMMELTDRMLWLDKLVDELHSQSETTLSENVLQAYATLRQQVETLNRAVFQPSQYHESKTQLSTRVEETQTKATELALFASRISAELRRQLAELGRQLADDVSKQQSRLNWLVTGLFLVVIGAGLYIDASVSRRISALQRKVQQDSFGGIALQPKRLRGDEIEQLATAISSYKKHLNDHARSAQDAVRAKNRFLAGASHDLRQPVQALALFLETLRSAELPPPVAAIVEQARAASAASREMLDTLMDYSRIEAGVLKYKAQPVALAPLLRRLEKEYGPQADAKQLVFRLRDSEDWVHADPTLLFMLLRNLVSNALRYTEQGGVLAAVRRRGALRCVEIWDTGIGIAPEHHALIFEEFRQVNDGPTDSKGLGLGLAIVRELADLLNAQVTLASVPGRGSVFRICLPAWQADTPEPSLPSPWHGDEDAAYLPLTGLHVLIVEDEPLVRQALASVLTQWQCEVSSAASLSQVQRLMARNNHDAGVLPDVVLTDLRLSKSENGGMVIHAIREAAAFSANTPTCIILTGDTAPERLQMADQLGATLLHKPIEPRALHTLLAATWCERFAPVSTQRQMLQELDWPSF